MSIAVHDPGLLNQDLDKGSRDQDVIGSLLPRRVSHGSTDDL